MTQRPNDQHVPQVSPVSPDATKGHGRVLIVHGLNLAPARMNSLAQIAVKLGMTPCAVHLKGHAPEDTSADFAAVTADIWREQLTAALRAKAPHRHTLGTTPAAATIAYSLGAVCYLAALAKLSQTEPRLYQEPDAHVLLAPALATRPWSHLLRPLRFWPKLTIPSANPVHYRRHRGTPMAAYMALEGLMSDVRRATDRGFRLHNPVLLAVHPRDELVSPLASQALLERLCPEPGQLTVMQLSNRQGSVRPKFAHLVLDADCLGAAEFGRLSEAIARALTLGRRI